MGFEISSAGCESDVDQTFAWIAEHEKTHVVACANPHSLVVAARDPVFSESLANADLLLPDGVGVILAARILGLPIRERVIGYDFFMEFTKRAAKQGGLRYFFLGSTESALDLIAGRLKREFPMMTVCGMYAPPFSDNFSANENDTIIDLINHANPDVLWVGMTAPRQEKWIQLHHHRLRVPCIAAVGAVFDFYSGIKKRSPDFWCRLGLEWLYRLAREPFRLWERSVVSAPLFLLMVLKEFIRWRVLNAVKQSFRHP